MPDVHAFSTIPHKILVPVDFSPSAHSALESAAELAQNFHADIHLVHVIPMFPTTTIPDYFPEEKYTEALRANAAKQFAACAADLAAKEIKVTSSIEVGDDVAGGILEAAEREKVDMVVISTHGLTGWYPLVFGSIAEKVVKLAQCPVLLLRTAKPVSSATVKSGRMMEWW